MAAERKYDWESVRLEYVMGAYNGDKNMQIWPTAITLSEKHNVPLPQLQVRMSNERWSVQRRDFQDRCYQEALARGVEERSLQINEFDFMCEKTANTAIQFIYEQLRNVQDEIEKERLVVKYAKPLLDYQKAGRLALSLPTDINGHEIELIKQDIDKNTDNMTIEQLRSALKTVNENIE